MLGRPQTLNPLLPCQHAKIVALLSSQSVQLTYPKPQPVSDSWFQCAGKPYSSSAGSTLEGRKNPNRQTAYVGFRAYGAQGNNSFALTPEVSRGSWISRGAHCTWNFWKRPRRPSRKRFRILCHKGLLDMSLAHLQISFSLTPSQNHQAQLGSFKTRDYVSASSR